MNEKELKQKLRKNKDLILKNAKELEFAMIAKKANENNKKSK